MRGYLAVVFLLIPLMAAAQTTRPFPKYEDFDAGQSQQFVREARAWVSANRESPLVPRVLMDAITVAGAVKDEATAKEMRDTLFIEHGTSIPARYLAGSFKDGDALAEALLAAMQSADLPWTRGRMKCLVAVLEQGQRVYGSKALGDRKLALACRVLARAEGAAALQEVAERKLKESPSKDADVQAMTALLLENPKTPEDTPQTIEKLHAISGATLFEGMLLATLGPEQRELPVMRQIMAELLTNRARPATFATAAGIFDALPVESQTAKVLCLRAWCRAAGGDAAAAVKLAEEARGRFPDDPWTATAGQIADNAADKAKRIDQYAAALVAMSLKLQQGVDTLEARIEGVREKGSPLKIYIGLSPAAFEFQIVRGKALAFAYRTEATSCRVFVGDQGVIYSFSEGGAVPGPQMTLSKQSDGFHLDGGMQLTENGQALKNVLAALASSPYLCTQSGVLELLEHQCRRGGIMLPVVETADGKTYAWLNPSVEKATPSVWKMTLDKDGNLTRLTTAQGVAALRYGPASSVTLSPPDWPAARVIQQKKLDLATLMKLVQSVVAMVQEE